MFEDMNESIMMPQAQFRSRLNSLPLDLKCELGEIPLQKGLRPTTRKEKVIEILNKYNIKYYDVNYLSILIEINNAKNIINNLRNLDFDIDLLSDYDKDNKESNIVILGYTAISIENIKKGLEIIYNEIKNGSNY